MRHQKTRIYLTWLDLKVVVNEAIAGMPQGHSDLTKQLTRSSSSIGDNFSEGYGRAHAKERRHFFDIARGSALEAAAQFDDAFLRGIITRETRDRGNRLCDGLSGMLYKWK